MKNSCSTETTGIDDCLLVTIEQACKMMALSRPTIYKLFAEGKLRAKKIGRKTVIPRQSVVDYIDSLPAWRGVN